VWVVAPDEATGEMAITNISDAIGECDIYVVDAFEDMVATDLTAEDITYVLNIMRSDGIAYILLPEIGQPLPLGVVILGVEGLDKGYTQDLYAETEIGIYTTQAQYDTFQKWFIRELGEWKEISAYTNTINVDGSNNIDVQSGDITSVVYAFSDVLSGNITEIEENWFLMRNGQYVNYIGAELFLGSRIRIAVIPQFIENINSYAFAYCEELTEVTFKGTPSSINDNVFDYCDNLTTINVPWAEDDPINANKPWGATNAEINFNYMEG
jgi:hypothetical protein